MGWDQFAKAAGLKLVDQAPDPANPGQVLSPYDVPRKVLNLKVRVLVCANATRERGGTRRTFAEMEFPVVNPRAGSTTGNSLSPLSDSSVGVAAPEESVPAAMPRLGWSRHRLLHRRRFGDRFRLRLNRCGDRALRVLNVACTANRQAAQR